jgi:hypothetical protein
MQSVKDNYYIAWGPAYGGSHLLRSKTGTPEGPYEDLGPLHHSAIAPFIFVDDDGTAYFICGGDVLIARMKDDMTAPAEKYRKIGPADGSALGFEGPEMIKAHGKYILFLATRSQINQTEAFGQFRDNTYDLMYCWSDSIYGPYSTARLAVPHAGQCNPFKGKDGRWYSTVFGSDATSPFMFQFGLVPLDVLWEKDQIIVRPAAPVVGSSIRRETSAAGTHPTRTSAR